MLRGANVGNGKRCSQSPADPCSLAKGDRRSAGFENVSNPGGLNAFRGRSKLQSFVGRSPDLKTNCLLYQTVVKQKSHHSGATARDSHPFPYSPQFAGAPDAF